MRPNKKVEKYAECGAFGHAWFQIDTSSWNPPFLGNPIVLRCERCGAERKDSVTFQTGELINRMYHLPTDYSYPKGQRPSRSDFRKAVLIKQRRLEKQQAEESNIISIPKRRKIS